MKKKTLLLALLLLSATACGKNEVTDHTTGAGTVTQTTTEAVTEVSTEAEKSKEKNDDVTVSCQPSDWESYDKYNEMIDGDDKDRFVSAMQNYDDIKYTPISLLATQVVSGTNYAYLAVGKTVSEEPQLDYYIVVIYTDLNQKSEVISIKKLDPEDIKYKEISDGSKVGSWQAAESGKLGMFPNERAQASFEQAISSEEKLLFSPVAIVAAQYAMTGTVYKAICFGKTNDEAAVTELYYVKWFVYEADHKGELHEFSYFDLESYVSN